jgi:hypothetical protein
VNHSSNSKAFVTGRMLVPGRKTLPAKMILHRFGLARMDGNTDFFNYFVQQGRGCHLAQAALGPNDQAMSENGLDHALDVIGQYEVTALDGRERLAGTEKCDRGPRAAAQVNVVMRPRSLDDIEDVLANLVVHVNGPHGFLTVQQFLGTDDRTDFVDGMAELKPLQHIAVLLGLGL